MAALRQRKTFLMMDTRMQVVCKNNPARWHQNSRNLLSELHHFMSTRLLRNNARSKFHIRASPIKGAYVPDMRTLLLLCTLQRVRQNVDPIVHTSAYFVSQYESGTSRCRISVGPALIASDYAFSNLETLYSELEM